MFPDATLRKHERAADQAKRDAALHRLEACNRVLDRMRQELLAARRKQSRWVPSPQFDEALYWAELQLRRARFVQERNRLP
jgi:hypothetical protein